MPGRFSHIVKYGAIASWVGLEVVCAYAQMVEAYAQSIRGLCPEGRYPVELKYGAIVPWIGAY